MTDGQPDSIMLPPPTGWRGEAYKGTLQMDASECIQAYTYKCIFSSVLILWAQL